MKDLILSVVHIVALAWLAVQTTAMAASGSWIPLGIFFVVLALALIIVGCWPLAEAKVDRFGGLFAIVVALGLLLLAISAFREAGAGSGAVRILLSLGYAVFAGMALRRASSTPAHA